LECLKEIPKADLYFVDGDHNYWTVKNELMDIFNENKPLVILHDVGFPCDRRDLYYNPDDIPEKFLSDYSYDKGVDIDNNLVDHGGFNGAGNFAFSLEANKNNIGVLTAVEDFLKTRPDLCYVEIPLIFGLGFIGEKNLINEKIFPIVEPYTINLMYELEKNRMSLYLRVLDLQAKIDKLRGNRLFRIIQRFIY
jgi:hypothetical protein